MDVTVRFKPDLVNIYEDTLSIFNNDPGDAIVYVYLSGNGIQTGIQEDFTKIPGAFFISQNYPNPFIDATGIKFGLSKDADVKITVYNLIGQEVMILVNERKKGGYYQITWDGKDRLGNKLATGVYFYRLEAGDYKSTKKFVILR